jgi:hypothetical protein
MGSLNASALDQACLSVCWVPEVFRTGRRTPTKQVEAVNDIGGIAVVDIYDIGDDEYAMSLQVMADIDVYYTVSAPTGYDLEFAPHWDVDGIEAGAPFLMNTERKDLALDIEVTWDTKTKEWRDVDVRSGHEVGEH